MSTSGARFHIPFPTAFLSLNTPTKKATGDVVTSPESEVADHSFLSNRSVVPRHSSISSVSSSGSTIAPSSPPANATESPILKAASPAFLTLNSKFTAPPPATKEVSSAKTSFLSNRV